MTIDEYLGLANKLRRHVATCEKRYFNTFTRATSPKDPLNLDGTPTSNGSTYNSMERKFIENADASRELTKARKTYQEYLDLVRGDMKMLYFWEGLVIERIYFENPIVEERDPRDGINYILNTNNRREIRKKVDEAKRHLTDIMRARGVDIDYPN